MADEKLKLLKRYRYDKSETRDKDEAEYTWSATENVYTLAVYEYRLETFVVRSSWYYKGSGDMEGSDHYESLSFTVYPISPEDAENEEVVCQIASGEGGYATQIGDRPQVDIKDEEAYTSSVHYYVMGAIDAYIAERKKNEASRENLCPNAVYVSNGAAPKSVVIYDFDSDAGLGTVFYNCTSVGIKPLDERSQKNLGIDRPLCYYYPVGRGVPGVTAILGSEMFFATEGRYISVYMSNKWDTGNSAVICAYENGKAKPLTSEEVQKILDFPTEK